MDSSRNFGHFREVLQEILRALQLYFVLFHPSPNYSTPLTLHMTQRVDAFCAEKETVFWVRVQQVAVSSSQTSAVASVNKTT